MSKATKEENENQYTVTYDSEPENHTPPSKVTKLKDNKWEPVEWPTVEELHKLHEDKTLVGTVRTILEKSVDN